MANTVFNRFKYRTALEGNWTSDDVRCLLLNATSTYTPNPDHNFVSDILNNGGIELSTTNYSRKTLSSKTATQDDTNNRAKLDAADVTWTALGPSSAGPSVGAIVVFRHNASGDASSEVVSYHDSGFPKQTNGEDFTVNWSPNGIVTLS